MAEDSHAWVIALRVVLVLAAVAATLAAALLAYAYRRLRTLAVPQDAGLFTTLRHVPIALPIALDLLDLALDVFATPIVWKVLAHFRMHALRNIAAAEALIPFTQPLPTFTTLWLAARLFNLGVAPPRIAPPRHQTPPQAEG